MNNVLGDLEKFALPCLVDVPLLSSTLGEHIEHVQGVFERLRKVGFTAKEEKIKVARADAKSLGHFAGSAAKSRLK